MRSFRVIKLFFILLLLPFLFNKTIQVLADTTSTVFVPPTSSNFQFSLDSSNKDQIFHQEIVIPYTITYGASLSAVANTDNTISVDYFDDLINGIHVFDYIPGSATNGYGNAVPVVDLINRKITWQILNLPAGTIDQLLTLNIRTNSDYRGDTPVTFKVKANMSNQYATFPQLELAKTYKYLAPTPAPVLIQPSATPTPTPPTAPGVGITDVVFNNVSNNGAEITINTASPSKIAVFYGTDIHSLSSSFQTGSFSTSTIVRLDNLKPDNIYYLRIEIVDNNGNRSNSEIFTFKSAKNPPATINDKNVFVLSALGEILTTVVQGSADNGNTITIPEGVSMQANYSAASSDGIQKVEIALRNNHILGVNTYSEPTRSNLLLINMAEKENGVFFANLPAIMDTGSYELFIRITEKNGNIYEHSVSGIRSSMPLQIKEKGSNKSLSGVRTFFYFYNVEENKFTPITSSFGSVKNPNFTDSQGVISTAFPKGKYKVDVSTLFHKATTVEFDFNGPGGYPVIYLEKTPWDVLGVINYLTITLYDSSNNLKTFMDSSPLFIRYFNILAVFVVVVAIIITFLLFAFKTNTQIQHLPLSLYHHLHASLPGQPDMLFGRVISEDKIPVPQAQVFILTKDGNVIFHTMTNKKGVFAYNNDSAFNIQVIKEGFEETIVPTNKDNHLGITLLKKPNHVSLENTLVKETKSILGLFFETGLVLSLILEYLFSLHFGLLSTLPFLILSISNIFLWLFYIKN